MSGGVGPSTTCDKTGLFARFLNSTSNGNMAMHHGVNAGSIQGACSSSGLLEGAANAVESDWDPYENTSIYYPFVYNHKKVSITRSYVFSVLRTLSKSIDARNLHQKFYKPVLNCSVP